MTLEDVVPWGRSYEEYLAMFDLTPVELKSRVFGCGDVPAAFNAVLTRRGGFIVSVNPIYRTSSSAVAARC
jgi:hypothetical protein